MCVLTLGMKFDTECVACLLLFGRFCGLFETEMFQVVGGRRRSCDIVDGVESLRGGCK